MLNAEAPFSPSCGGSDHEKVIDIPMPIEEGERRLYSIRCEGKAVNKYMLLTVAGARPSQSIDDDEVESFRGVYTIDLETMKIVQIDLPQSPDDSINPLVNNGNKLYAITSHSEDLVTISEIDLTWGVSRVLYVGKYGVNYTSRGYYLSGDTLYYVEFINDGDLYDRMRTLYSLNVVTCEREMIRQERNADAAWLTFDSYSGYNYAERDKLEEDPAKRGIYINDMDLDLLEFIPFSELPFEAGGKLKPSYITHDYIFGAGPVLDGKSVIYNVCSGIPVWYLDKSEIGSGNMQWHRWEPDG